MKNCQETNSSQERSARQVGKKVSRGRKKAKRFNETSKDNIDELKALLPGAKEKLSAD